MLTTKKYKREVQKLGFETKEGITGISIYFGDERVSYVCTNVLFSLNTAYFALDDLSEELQEKLYNLIDEYARTPLDEREEPQKYYLRFTALTEIGDCNYLNYCATEETIYLSNRITKIVAQTQFTQKEIDEIKEKFGVTLSDFEQIRVEDDKE